MPPVAGTGARFRRDPLQKPVGLIRRLNVIRIGGIIGLIDHKKPWLITIFFIAIVKHKSVQPSKYHQDSQCSDHGEKTSCVIKHARLAGKSVKYGSCGSNYCKITELNRELSTARFECFEKVDEQIVQLICANPNEKNILHMKFTVGIFDLSCGFFKERGCSSKDRNANCKTWRWYCTGPKGKPTLVGSLPLFTQFYTYIKHTQI